MDTNFVLAGQYEGGIVKTDKNDKVYIEHLFKTYLDKINVISIEKLNEESSSFKTSATFWLGSVASAGLSDVKDVILKITWRDNTESMIKVREGIYTKILATRMLEVEGTYHISTKEEIKKREDGEKLVEHFREIFIEKGMFIIAVIKSPKSDKDILEILPICLEIYNADKEYNILEELLSKRYLSDDLRFYDFISTCRHFVYEYGDTSDPSNATKYLRYTNVQSIEYTIEKVTERLRVYDELGNYLDCKRIVETVGDYNNPENVKKYISYLQNFDRYLSHKSPQDMEEARQAFEDMGDYLDAKSLADKNNHKEYCSCFFPEASQTTSHNTSSSTNTNNKTGCYVATCVYGSYDCPEVWTLRRFRDNTLGSTWYGRAFIRTYYTISPTLVKWFGNTAWFKKMWRGTLDRMVKKLEATGVQNTPYEDKKW